MFNLVVLTGRLTADPELRYTSGNIPVTSFSIAVNRRYKAGEQSEADFINIISTLGRGNNFKLFMSGNNETATNNPVLNALQLKFN